MAECFCDRDSAIRFVDSSDLNEICFLQSKLPLIMHSLWPKYVCLCTPLKV